MTTPKQKWKAITFATLLLLPGFWALLAGLVAIADGDTDGPNPAAALALGLAVVPFVFLVLAFVSRNARPSRAVLQAMGLALLVGIPASALAGDAVTGIVAGVGAGGIRALRPEPDHGWRPRACAVAIAAVYTFVLARSTGALVLLSAPIFPLTALGLADQWVEWRRERRPVTA